MGSLPNYLNHAWPTSREHERRNLDTPLQVTWNGNVMRGWCNDLCISGMGFTLAAPLKMGEPVAVEFVLPEKNATIQTEAVLRWSDGFRHGCEFLKVTADAAHAIHEFMTKPEKQKKRAKKQ